MAARPGPFQDWVDAGALRAELEASLSGRRAIGLQVWRWLSLEAWSQHWLASDPRVGESSSTLASEGAAFQHPRADADGAPGAGGEDPA